VPVQAARRSTDFQKQELVEFRRSRARIMHEKRRA
jgi:hypothetical protein